MSQSKWLIREISDQLTIQDGDKSSKNEEGWNFEHGSSGFDQKCQSVKRTVKMNSEKERIKVTIYTETRRLVIQIKWYINRERYTWAQSQQVFNCVVYVNPQETMLLVVSQRHPSSVNFEIIVTAPGWKNYCTSTWLWIVIHKYLIFLSLAPPLQKHNLRKQWLVHSFISLVHATGHLDFARICESIAVTDNQRHDAISNQTCFSRRARREAIEGETVCLRNKFIEWGRVSNAWEHLTSAAGFHIALSELRVFETEFVS